VSHVFSILIIDPNEDLRGVLIELIQHRGHDARAVARLDDVYAVARQQAPDVVLIDTFLIDGTEPIDAVRATHPSVRCVVGMCSHPRQRTHPGCDAVLSLPFTAEHLLGVVEQILSCGPSV
jgi:CheY-like chemotaxis protein